MKLKIESMRRKRKREKLRRKKSKRVNITADPLYLLTH